MNATQLLNAAKAAQKPAAIGLLTILGLGIATTLAISISNLLALLIPVLVIASKVTIYGYPLFIAGLILINSQKKATPKIELLPPCKPFKQQEMILNEVLITPPSLQTIFNNYLKPKQQTWQQMITEEIQQKLQKTIEIEARAIPETPNPRRETQRKCNPFNQLNIAMITWQMMNELSTLLNNIKASEMKTIASELQIPKYRNMNKSQLLIEIVSAHQNAPEFSE